MQRQPLDDNKYGDFRDDGMEMDHWQIKQKQEKFISLCAWVRRVVAYMEQAIGCLCEIMEWKEG